MHISSLFFCIISHFQQLALRLKSLSSWGVSESARPTTGITFTLGLNRRINSISISRNLYCRLAWIFLLEACTSLITHAWPVGEIKYNNACTRLSRKRGLRLIRDSSARMSSYCRSRYPTISWKLWIQSLSKRKPSCVFSRYHRSLSILSPNPGVSTIVSEILSWKDVWVYTHTHTRALLDISQFYRLVLSPFLFSPLLFYLTPSSSSSKEKE